MTSVIVGRWGQDLAVRIPPEIAGALAEGENVEMVSEGADIVIRKRRVALTAEQLFAGRSDEAWRALYADAFDWGPDVGRERIEE